MSILVGDIETNGFKPSIIWVVGIIDYNTRKFKSYTGDAVAEGLLRLAEAECVIGHNFKDYDAKQIERLTDGLVTIDNEKIVDTLELSRKVEPTLSNHKLETWGEILGRPKIDFKRFDKFDPLMVPYCRRDCEINLDLFNYLMSRL